MARFGSDRAAITGVTSTRRTLTVLSVAVALGVSACGASHPRPNAAPSSRPSTTAAPTHQQPSAGTETDASSASASPAPTPPATRRPLLSVGASAMTCADRFGLDFHRTLRTGSVEVSGSSAPIYEATRFLYIGGYPTSAAAISAAKHVVGPERVAEAGRYLISAELKSKYRADVTAVARCIGDGQAFVPKVPPAVTAKQAAPAVMPTTTVETSTSGGSYTF